jgi:voltage-gated potassium channel
VPVLASDRAATFTRRASIVGGTLAIPAVVLDEIAPLHGSLDHLARALNWALWALFAVALLVQARRLGWRVIREEPVLCLVVLLTTPVAPPGVQFGRVLQLVALVRLAGAGHLVTRVFSLEGLRYAGLVLILTVVGGGMLLPVVERPVQRLSGGDGIWWAVETVTTVGYGDIVPRTTAGRVLGGIIMAVGIGTAALVIGAVGRRLSPGGGDDDAERAALEDRVARLERELGELRGEPGEAG